MEDLSRTLNGLRVESLRNLSLFDLRAMECLQVLNGTRAAEVEDVLAEADVSRMVPLPLRDMCELVLNHRALPQRRPSCGGLKLLAQTVLQRLIFSDGHGPAVPR
jgi:hypothetical protein